MPGKRISNGASGFSLVEIAIAIVVFVVGVIGFANTLILGTQMSRNNADRDAADMELSLISEQFRRDTAFNFDEATRRYKEASFFAASLPGFDGEAAEIATRLLTDETRLDPAIDLNGDGDATDKNVSLSALRLAALHMSVTWNFGGKPMSQFARLYVARGEVNTLASAMSAVGSSQVYWEATTGASAMERAAAAQDLAAASKSLGTSLVPGRNPKRKRGWLASKRARIRRQKGKKGGAQTGGTTPAPKAPVAAPLIVQGTSLSGGGSSVDSIFQMADQTLNIVAVTVEANRASYVKSITMNGKTVFIARKRTPPVRHLIRISPTQMKAQSVVTSSVLFQRRRRGTALADMTGADISLVFHTDDGRQLHVKLNP